MVDLYRGVDGALTEDQLFSWHRMVVSGRTDLRISVVTAQVMSQCRWCLEPATHRKSILRLLFNSRAQGNERRFLDWFTRNRAGNGLRLAPTDTSRYCPSLLRIGSSVEDAMDVSGRVVAEKALVQGFGQPIIVALPVDPSASCGLTIEALRKLTKPTMSRCGFGGFLPSHLRLNTERSPRLTLSFTRRSCWTSERTYQCSTREGSAADVPRRTGRV